MLFIWAMKRDAEVMKRAVPSMFTVAPIGRTNLFKGEEKRIWTHFETLGSTRLLVMHLKDTGRAAALGNIFVGLTDIIKESSRGSCGKCSHPGLKKATVEGKRIPSDDGQVDERVGQQLVGEDRRADGDDEEPKLRHHPAQNPP